MAYFFLVAGTFLDHSLHLGMTPETLRLPPFPRGTVSESCHIRTCTEWWCNHLSCPVQCLPRITPPTPACLGHSPVIHPATDSLPRLPQADSALHPGVHAVMSLRSPVVLKHSMPTCPVSWLPSTDCLSAHCPWLKLLLSWIMPPPQGLPIHSER